MYTQRRNAHVFIASSSCRQGAANSRRSKTCLLPSTAVQSAAARRLARSAARKESTVPEKKAANDRRAIEILQSRAID